MVNPSSQLTLKQMQRVCTQAAQPLLQVAHAGAEAIHTFDFDLVSLRDFSSLDIRYDEEHAPTFARLAAITGPAVYVFEITSTTNPALVLAAARAYNGTRIMPAFRSAVDDTSRTLYVGKVKSKLWGRVIQHLGFYKVERTQGLQLFHWTRQLDLHLRLTVFEFRSDMADLLPLLEKATADLLKPLLGKHK